MNVITIMSDEHSWSAMGCSGNALVKTPNLDRLAAMSTNFNQAYTTCPLCVPARASWFTGQYVNRLGTWDNSTPYDGTVEGISQYLNRYHIPTYHFGKTHFHCDGEYDFAELEMPGFLNVPDLGCYYRDEKVGRIHAEKRFEKIGIKQAPDHDDQVTELAVDWLKKNSEKKEPWNLDIGYLDPHFPFYVKQENWDYFENLLTEIPQGTLEPYTSLNEPLGYLRAYFKGEVATPEIIRKVWIGYYAAVAELDERIGIILDTLEELDLLKNTAIIYTSDHGEQLGYHGLWWKCCMFEQSAHIPMLIYHPEMKGNTQEHPVTLADLYPTVCEMMGLPHPDHISGESLFTLMKYGQDAGRRDFAFSEYHAHGMPVGMFMIRWDHYKYVSYEGFRPQLFDLLDDPEEDHDLAGSPEHEERIQKLIEEGERRLRSVCDPKEVNDRAKEYQKRMKKALGVESGYTLERGTWVPHPEQQLEAQLKPNILFFMTDHQRADTLGMVQCGREVTPNLNKLARIGFQFDRAYDACPLCVPARTALATGIYPTKNGVIYNDWAGKTAGMIKPIHTLLKEAGYQVGHVGVDHIKVKPCMREQGLDYFINQEDYEKWADSIGIRTTRNKTELTEVLEDIEGESVSKRYSGHQVSVWDKPLHQFKDFYFRDRSLEFLKQLPKEPFALFTYLWAPHPPLRVPEPYASMYDPEQIVLPDNLGIPAEAEPQLRRKGVPAQLAEGVSLTEWKKVWAAHLGLTTMADEILGQILKELEDQGRLDQTLVIFTADHGDHLGQHGMYQKMEMYEEAIHVPFVIKMPWGKAGRSHGIVSHLDLMPTICEATGIEAGACDGISLLPIMQGKHPDPDRIVFSQYSGNPGYGTVRRAAISERYKYIFDNQYEHELYDLSKDPHEMKNVAKDPAYTNILKDLYECCQKYHTEHRDCFKWEGENVKV